VIFQLLAWVVWSAGWCVVLFEVSVDGVVPFLLFFSSAIRAVILEAITEVVVLLFGFETFSIPDIELLVCLGESMRLSFTWISLQLRFVLAVFLSAVSW